MEDQNSQHRSLWIIMGGLAAGGTILAGWLLSRRSRKAQAPCSQQVPESEIDENVLLKQENQQLQQQVTELQKKITTRRFPAISRQQWAHAWPRLVLWLVCLALAFIPSWLVFQEYWLEKNDIRDSFRQIWCRSEFLCSLALPSYSLLVVPMILLLVVLLVVFFRINQADVVTMQPKLVEQPVRSSTQVRTGRILAALGGLAALVILGINLANGGIPGAEIALVIMVYLTGQVLVETPLVKMKTWLLTLPRWLLPLIAAQIALLLFLRDIYGDHRTVWATGLLLAGTLAVLWKFRKGINPVLWVFLGAQVLFLFRINHWQFSIVGDEYSFFGFASGILHNGLAYTLKNLFHGQGVYGTHPFFSSLLQALSMGLFGQDNFGWRLSSLYLAAASLVFFYLFLRRFTSRRVAMISAVLMGGSSYLMTFGKVGYNNLQALFMLTVVLWLAGKAATSGRAILFTMLGAAMGICLYVYPAALYVLPLPLVLLLFYGIHPFTRRGLGAWALLSASFFFFLVPLVTQTGYWVEKLPGTFLYNPELILEHKLGFHFASNLLYSFFSYLYIPDETHFVTASYLDPLAAMLVPVGLAWVIKRMRRSRFEIFTLVGFLLTLLLVGTTHDRLFPAATRMFLVLPWFLYLAACGLDWIISGMEGERIQPVLIKTLVTILILAILGTNLYQAYGLSRQRTLGTPNLEMLFIRWLQRDADKQESSQKTYLFLTEPDWGIDGIRLQRDVYGLPESQAQLLHYPTENGDLNSDTLAHIREEDTMVIIQPWMKEDLRLALEERLIQFGKQPCGIHDTPGHPATFTLWMAPKWMADCPAGGNW